MTPPRQTPRRSHARMCHVDDCRSTVPDDVYVCDDCLSELDVLLAAYPSIEAQLQIVLTKQTSYSTKGPGKASEKPMMFNTTASNIGHAINNTLSTWVRIIMSEHACPAIQPEHVNAELIEWLRDQLTWLSRRAEGAEAVAEIVDALEQVSTIVDRPPDLNYLGPCTNCGHSLYVKPSNQTYVECDACIHVHNADQLRQRALMAAQDSLAHSSLISRAVTMLGESVSPVQISRWVAKGRLVVRQHDRNGRPMYRVGDVIELARAEMAKRASRKIG